MKLRLLTLNALLATSFASYAMDETKETPIKIPTADVLKKRLLYTAGFFLYTQIITKLADQEKTPKEVATTIRDSMEDYYKHLDETKSKDIAEGRKKVMKSLDWYVFDAFFKDYPEALKKLEKDGLYTPKE